jgi:hypothetical protein
VSAPFTARAVQNAERLPCQTCHTAVPAEDAHWGGVGSMGEELFFCLDHCPQCAAPHPRYVDERTGWGG